MKRKELIKNLFNKDIQELTKELIAEQEKFDNARINLGLGKLKNYSILAETKKNIARIQTILNLKADELISSGLAKN